VLFTHQGRFLRERLENKATWATERRDDAAPPWRPALEALGRHLPAAKRSSPSASFVLSSHFCHYALLRKSDELTGPVELLAYARHRMKAMFGEAVGHWAFKLSDGGEKSGYLASAIDGQLLTEIRVLCRDKNLHLTSIRPHLAVAFNHCRKALRNRSAWFVVHEEGRFVVSLFRNGNWTWLASRRAAPQWKAGLSNLLDREQQLVEAEGAECRQVILYAPGLSDAGDFRGSRFQVEMIRPDASDALEDRNYAMAA
jgi:hypothetical protein